MNYSEIKEIARKFRNNPTDAEIKLWDLIRKRKINGKKFLRQHPIIFETKGKEHFFYIPDFFCAEEKLLIELDGKIHDSRKEKDDFRDEILVDNGFRILRIKNEELEDISYVIKKIESMIYILSPPYQ